MKPNKDKKYSFTHVQERLKERYNLTINEFEYLMLHTTIKNLEPTKDEGEQLIYDVYFKGEKIIVVYSKQRGYITTVLPPKKFKCPICDGTGQIKEICYGHPGYIYKDCYCKKKEKQPFTVTY